MTAIIDYGVGNLFSLRSSLQAVGAEPLITGDAKLIRSADRLVLPGVGAFSDASSRLRASGLDRVLSEETKKGKALLGICLGMQLLFEKSFEFGEFQGLGLIKGQVVPISSEIPSGFKIPHTGWNSLCFKGSSPLFKYIKDGDYVYFVHSFHGKNCEQSVIATVDYGAKLTAAVARDNIFGCQFHPEKSGKAGLNILRAFCETGGAL